MTKKIVNPSDSALFRQTIGEVKAVKSDKLHLKPENRPKPYPKPKSDPREEVWLNNIHPDLEDVGHEESLTFTAPGVQNNVLAKLRKGFFGVQAELDLHGLTSEAAKQRLLEFIAYGTIAGFRCVQVIHGKGYRSSDALPVLKNNLNRWLRQHKDVQAFCSTPQRHGGTGAVYVLLKSLKSGD